MTGQPALEVKVNYNPQPVNNYGQGKRALDTSTRGQPGDFGTFTDPRTGEIVSNPKVDVVILTDQPRWNDTVTINALLDRINPDFIIHGGSNGAAAMARTWAISRGKEQAEFIPNWGDNTANNPGDGAAAGPIRNGKMISLGRSLMQKEGKTVLLFYFPVLDDRGLDPITNSMTRLNNERNLALAEAQLSKYVIPAFNGLEWMRDDALASNPFLADLDRESVDLPIPTLR